MRSFWLFVKPKGSKVTAAAIVAAVVNVLTVAGAIAGFFPGNNTAVAVGAIAATDAPILAAWLKAESAKPAAAAPTVVVAGGGPVPSAPPNPPNQPAA